MVRRIEKPEAGACAVGGFISSRPAEVAVLVPMMGCVEDRRGRFGSGLAYAPLTDGISGQQVNRLDRNGRIIASHETPSLEAMLRDPSVLSWSSDVVCQKGVRRFAELPMFSGTNGGLKVRGAVSQIRFPTGTSPAAERSHPFATGPLGLVRGFACAINGDDVSLSPKVHEAKTRLAQVLSGMRYSDDRIAGVLRGFESRLTGSDSEVISWLTWSRLAAGEPFGSIASSYTDPSVPFSLQGPCTAVCLVSLEKGEERQLYLWAFTDRDGHRPLVCGEYTDATGITYYLVASEEQQMPVGTRVRRPRAGRWVLATPGDGWVETGDRVVVSVPLVDRASILTDYAGYFGTTDLIGAVAQDDVGTAASCDIICFGYSGRRFGNAFQGKYAYVGDTIGPYGFIQFRNPEAVGIVEGGADKHFAHMATGGSMFVLRKNDEDVANGLASGIVGTATVYIRGTQPPSTIGKEYDRERAQHLFVTLLRDDKITRQEYDAAQALDFNPSLASVNDPAKEILYSVFRMPYPIAATVRKLTDGEKTKVREFYTTKGVKSPEKLEVLLADDYTVVVSTLPLD